MKEHHLHWYQLQGQNLSLWSHRILAGNHGSDWTLLGKCSRCRNTKLFGQVQILVLCHWRETCHGLQKEQENAPPVYLLLWTRMKKNTQSSSKINTFQQYQQNLQFCALAPGQAGRQPARVFYMPNIPKHCGKIFPSFLSQSCFFSNQWLSVGNTVLTAWVWAAPFVLLLCKVKGKLF